MFDRDGKDVKPAAFAARPAARRPRTSWLAPPLKRGEGNSVEPPRPSRVPNFSAHEATAPAYVPDPSLRDYGGIPDESGEFAIANVPPSSQDFSQFAVDAAVDGLGNPPPVSFNMPPPSQMAKTLIASIEDVVRTKEHLVTALNDQVIELALAIARRVLARELTTDRSFVASLAREGMAALGAGEGAVVRVGEGFGDREMQDLRARLHDTKCEVVVDVTLEPGRCIVEVVNGRVEESIDDRLRAVVDAIEAAKRGEL